MSWRFNRLVERDYGVPANRLGVVYQPADVREVRRDAKGPGQPIRLLFVGRISVRKGVDLLIETIPRVLLANPDVHLTVIGAGSLWSDYEPLLQDLPSERCEWLKSLSNEEVQLAMGRSDILLVPSMYEPGGIVVGEALANGMIVVVSDEVGSAENLPRSICKEFVNGDAAAFRNAIDEAIMAVRSSGGDLKDRAVRVAQEMFNPRRIVEGLVDEASRLCRDPRGLNARSAAGRC